MQVHGVMLQDPLRHASCATPATLACSQAILMAPATESVPPATLAHPRETSTVPATVSATLLREATAPLAAHLQLEGCVMQVHGVMLPERLRRAIFALWGTSARLQVIPTAPATANAPRASMVHP